ncbi:MAG: hypothetical protein HY276_05785 [Ignavibacteriales bacterium]|nr:hypothetical protein [Ignavibacteriales bacterium]
MFTPQRYLLILVVLICSGVIVGLLSSLSNSTVREITVTPSYRDIPKPSPQHATQRIWKPISDTPQFTIAGQENAVLLRPWDLKVDKAGNIYVLDGGDLSIKKFSSEGVFIRKFGSGKGKGPAEFLNPSHFVITASNEVWVIDPVNLRITAFSQNGAVVQTQSLKHQAHRIAYLQGAQSLVLSPSSTREYLFELFELKGQSVAMFGQFVQDQKKNNIALDGVLAEDGAEGIVYAFSRAGYIVSFDASGKLRFYVETIDPMPFPSVLETQRNGVTILTVDRKAPYATMSINVDGDEIYVFCMSESLKQKLAVVDTYSKKDGSYQYSFKLPTWADRMYVTKTQVYSLMDTTVTQWRR